LTEQRPSISAQRVICAPAWGWIGRGRGVDRARGEGMELVERAAGPSGAAPDCPLKVEVDMRPAAVVLEVEIRPAVMMV